MAKTKTLDQLRAEKEQAEAQLLQEQHKLQRLEQRKFPTIYSGRTHETPLRVVYTDERPAQPGKIEKRGRQDLPHQRKPIA